MNTQKDSKYQQGDDRLPTPDELKNLIRYRIVGGIDGKYHIEVGYRTGLFLLGKKIPLWWSEWEKLYYPEGSFTWNRDFSGRYTKRIHCVFVIQDHFKKMQFQPSEEIVYPENISRICEEYTQNKHKTTEL